MSVAAVMLVKDERDVIAPVVEHLLAEGIDEIIVADNLSTDGTYDDLLSLQKADDRIDVQKNPQVGYYQAERTTELAMLALQRGHRWVIPCDADEIWYSTDGRRIVEFLGGVAPDVQFVRAPLYNHLPTSRDNEKIGDPFRRIGWRQRQHQPLQFGKVACRLRPDLRIEQGNHSARTSGTGVEIHALCVRHFSWRSAEQYVRKIANGYRAYAASDLPASAGAHWRMHGDPAEPGFARRVREHFYEWFRSDNPFADETLIFDPAPIREES